MTMLHIISIAFTLIFVSIVFIFRHLTIPFSVIYSIISLKLANLRFDLNDDQKINNDISEYGEGGKLTTLPNHVAVILDGNKLWAQKQGLTTAEGFEAGAKRVVQNVKTFFVSGVNTVSLFTFCTQNCTKPADELNFVISLFDKHFKSEIPYFQREKIQISIIGNREKFSESLRSVIEEVEKGTNMNEDKHLIVAINYSGKYDLSEACKNIVLKTIDGQIKVEDINEEKISNEMQTMCSPFSNPDLLIRTKGEQRISNFFLWQLAYTELYFTPILWPDFGEAENLEALKWYQTRQRRFGQRI